jgi:AraC-like DNA-binding protein
VSRKHLVTLFRAHVGLPPKVCGRILRFHHAIELIRSPCAVGWSDLAVRCGYYDQAHLIRDVRQFAGVTPGELVTFVQDGAG